jgi:hypothetical protein
MKRLGVALAFLALFIGSALAQFGGMFPGPGTPHTTGGGSVTWTNTTSGINDACGFVTTCSITGLTVASGFNVVGVGGRQVGGTTDWTAVSLCGTSLTLIVSNGDVNGYPVDIWAGTVTGGTCTFSASGPTGTVFNLIVGIGLLSNLSSTTATSTCLLDSGSGAANQPYTCTSSLTVPSGGFGIGFGYTNFSGTGCTLTWANMTADSSQGNVTNQCGGISHTTTTTIAPSFNSAGFTNSGVVGATWH